MAFKSMQQTLHYTQINQGSRAQVFPLLCPVREADWLEGWAYQMIHSKSGLIEQDCVFSTPHHGAQDTIWQVTQYDPINYKIEFLRFTPGENVVKINIHLEALNDQQTSALIDYQYTALNESQNDFLSTALAASFKQSMQWWERAINHYLQTGEMLRK